jgi:hypothetical protein
MSPLRFLVLLAALAFLVPGARADGPVNPIPGPETRDPPTLARIRAIENAAATADWGAVGFDLHEAAVQAYAEQRYAAADAWFHVYQWSALFAETEDQFYPAYSQAVEAYHVNYPAVAGTFQGSTHPLGLNLSDALKDWVLNHEAFSAEFFGLIQPVDKLPNVLAILEALYRRSPDTFARYSSLALAIAVVYDVPPPDYWPHPQVSDDALPRRFVDPAVTYDRLIREDEAGHTLFRLDRLPADELKFVVDSAAPAEELDWSEENVALNLDQFDQTYFSVRYRDDRAATYAGMTWSGKPYTLPNILAAGGICVDQAYFATECGKARGVPTLLFLGNGQDGRHAWFGYLDGQHHWQLDAGRYAEQRLVTGNAWDPQTWTQLSDHEVQFLAERFRALPAYLASRVHEEFAVDFLHHGDPVSAAAAARMAVNYERRNLAAWGTLIQANAALALPPRQQEAVLREAALAFTPKYPDLVVAFENRVIASLRARGETSLAAFEERGVADRQRGTRDDLAVQQASAILSRSIATQPVNDQIATYNGIIAQYGRGSGTIFFDQIVVGFAEHLAALHMRADAREAVQRASDALDVQPGTMFAMDVEKLMTRLQD